MNKLAAKKDQQTFVLLLKDNYFSGY